MFLDPTRFAPPDLHLAWRELLSAYPVSPATTPLGRLRGVSIESVAWSPSLPTSTTREILIGASDGNIYETFIEPSAEFYRKERSI